MKNHDCTSSGSKYIDSFNLPIHYANACRPSWIWRRCQVQIWGIYNNNVSQSWKFQRVHVHVLHSILHWNFTLHGSHIRFMQIRSRHMIFISCDQAALRTLLSVRPSVCHTFFTMFPSSYHHEIFRSDYQWQKWYPCERSTPEVKGQGHRGKNST